MSGIETHRWGLRPCLDHAFAESLKVDMFENCVFGMLKMGRNICPTIFEKHRRHFPDKWSESNNEQLVRKIS
jgi:hypothetical protein